MRRRHRLSLLAIASLERLRFRTVADEPPVYEAYAVRYATLSAIRSPRWLRAPIRNESSTSR